MSSCFTGAFYIKLVEHGQVDWAIAFARAKIAELTGDEKLDWGIPLLYLQAEDGFIFRTY